MNGLTIKTNLHFTASENVNHKKSIMESDSPLTVSAVSDGMSTFMCARVREYVPEHVNSRRNGIQQLSDITA